MMRLGDYELIQEVGRGAFGAVYRARSAERGVVAVKIIRSTMEGERIARELRLLRDLGPGEGFVGLLDSGVTPQGCYLVMPFLGGGTLRDRLRGGPLSVADTVALGRAIAGALAHAHARGIVHRDLKPENVLYSEDGRPFLGDLGLAKHFRKDVAGASLSLSFSVGGDLKGTIGYAPPEQLRDAKEVGPSADVFAAGAILYECLAGEPAFSGETPLHVLEKVDSDTRAPIATLRPDAPRPLLATIERCLARDPARRFQDGAALLAALTTASSPRGGAKPVVALLLVALAIAAGLAGRHFLSPAPVAVAPPPPRVAAPPPAPPPAVDVPNPFSPLCASFLRGSRSRLRLVQLVGDYDWKLAGEVHALAYSPDGAWLLSGQGHHEKGEAQWESMLDHTLVLWDATNGHEVRRFAGHTSGVTGCAFLPAGDRAVSSSVDGTIRLWEVATGKSAGVFDAGAPVLGVAVGADGTTLVAALADGNVLLYDLARGDAPLALGRHEGACLAVAISADGALVLSGGADKMMRLWDVAARRRGDEGSGGGPWGSPVAVRVVAFTPDGRSFVGADDDGAIGRGDVATRRATQFAEANSSGIAGLVFWREGAITAHRDGTVRVRDPGTLVYRGELDRRFQPLRAIAATRDGSRVAWGGLDEAITVFAPGMDHAVAVHKATRVDFSRAEGTERIATGGQDGTVRLWDGATGQALWTTPPKGSQVYGVAFSHNGKRIATVWEAGSVRLWNAVSGDLEMNFEKHMGPSLRASFSLDDATILTCGDAGKIYAWDVIGDTRELAGHRELVFAIAHCPDGKRAVSCSRDRSVRVWDVTKGVEIRRIPNAHGELVGNLAVSPDGEHVITSSWDHTVKIWNLATGALVRELPKQKHVCWGLAYLDARRAVLGCYDGTIAVWDVTTGEKLDSVALSSATDWSGNLVPLGDGKTFLAGTGRGVVLRFVFE